MKFPGLLESFLAPFGMLPAHLLVGVIAQALLLRHRFDDLLGIEPTAPTKRNFLSATDDAPWRNVRPVLPLLVREHLPRFGKTSRETMNFARSKRQSVRQGAIRRTKESVQKHPSGMADALNAL